MTVMIKYILLLQEFGYRNNAAEGLDANTVR